MAESVAAGALTIDVLRSGYAATRALLAAADSPAPVSEPRKPASVAPPERSDEAAELLDDFLVALFDLPGDTWTDLAAALPDELFVRVDRYLDTLLSEPAAG